LFERQALELIKGLSESDVRAAVRGISISGSAKAGASASARQIDDSEMLVDE